MPDATTIELGWEAVVVTILAALVVRRDLGLPAAVAVALLRVAVPVIYFSWYFDGQWTILDDVTYFANGQRMLDEGFNPLSALTTFDGFEQLRSLSGGSHVLYCWWNVLAQYVFGSHYFAPVLLNVLVTFVAAHVLRKTTELAGFPTRYCRAMQLFYLLHWEVVAWSSFMNVKDPIVQLLTVTALYTVTRFFLRRDWPSVLGFVAVAQLFGLIRFYLPLLVMSTAIVWMLWQWKNSLKYLLVPLAVPLAYCAWPMLQEHAPYLNLESAAFGTARVLLTPIPGRIDECYSFLFLPALLHLAFLLPAAIGFLGLWRTCPLARLYLLYLLLILGLYAVTEELQGPRHRFQVAFVFVWIQFHFLWMLSADRRASVQTAVRAGGTARRGAPPALRPARAYA